MTRYRTCHPGHRRRAAYELTIAELVTELRQRADDPAAAAELAGLIAAAAAEKFAVEGDNTSATVLCWKCGADVDLDTEPFVLVNVAAVSRVEADGLRATAQRIFTSPERYADGCEAPELVLCLSCGDSVDACCEEQEAVPIPRAALARRGLEQESPAGHDSRDGGSRFGGAS